MRIVIVTKNAIHGGVESLIALHQKYLNAEVIVAGGHNFPETCPFRYKYIESFDQLLEELKNFDVISYHWPPDWAVQAVKTSGLPCVETVHRIDTAECDKSVPTKIIVHSEFLKDFIYKTYGLDSVVINNAIDVDSFPSSPQGNYIGGLTSYYDTKGIDLFLLAWSKINKEFPQEKIRFYGAGYDLPKYQKMIQELSLNNVELLGPVSNPQEYLKKFSFFVAPSRIEGMPVAILEALASNIPVLCSNLDGMVEFNKLAKKRGFDEPLILFNSEDVEDLASKLREVLLSRPVKKTRDYIKKYFDARVHCEQLRKTLEDAMRTHHQKKELPIDVKLENNNEWVINALNETKNHISLIRDSRTFRFAEWLRKTKCTLLGKKARLNHDVLSGLEEKINVIIRNLERKGEF